MMNSCDGDHRKCGAASTAWMVEGHDCGLRPSLRPFKWTGNFIDRRNPADRTLGVRLRNWNVIRQDRALTVLHKAP